MCMLVTVVSFLVAWHLMVAHSIMSPNLYHIDTLMWSEFTAGYFWLHDFARDCASLIHGNKLIYINSAHVVWFIMEYCQFRRVFGNLYLEKIQPGQKLARVFYSILSVKIMVKIEPIILSTYYAIIGSFLYFYINFISTDWCPHNKWNHAKNEKIKKNWFESLIVPSLLILIWFDQILFDA